MLMFYHSHTIDETLRDLHASSEGLSSAAADEKLRHYGSNKITHHTPHARTTSPLGDAYLLVLAVAFGCSLAIAEAVVATLLGTVIVINLGLRLFHHRSHRATVRRTTKLADDTALVKRDGTGVTLPIETIVPGDIVSLHAGDHIPADGRLIYATELHTKEYQLTGNEDPIAKHTAPVHSDSELEYRSNMVYRGSYVTSGSGQYVVTATGDATVYGAISRHVTHIEKRSTLQQKIARLTNHIILLSLGVAAVVAVVSLGRGAAWYTTAEYAIVIIVAAIPAMLPVVISIITTHGLNKLASQQALFTSLRAIENTSMLTTLVVSKSDFITDATPTIAELWQLNASDAELTKVIGQSLAWHATERDAIDAALAQSHPPSLDTARPAIQFLFDRRIQLSGNLWHYARHYELTIKGAPEKILDLAQLTENERETIQQQVQSYTARGYQVLALARCTSEQVIPSLTQLDTSSELQFSGLVALHYSVKPDAKRFLPQLRSAGVTPRLATGDTTDSSYALARHVDITSTRREAIDARRLTVVPALAAHRIITPAKVYARTTVDTTAQIISSLKRHAVVGATGEGAHDIPALIRAHIGITLKDNAALAHDASDIVLTSTSNHLQALHGAIKTTRSIVGNIRRVLFYTLTTNLAEVVLIMSTLLLTLPLALSPAQILWSNIVIYTILVLGLAVEPDSRNIMKRRPVSPRTPILPAFLGLRICLLALTMAVVTCAVFIVTLGSYELIYAQALAFHAFVTMQIISLIAARSDHTSLFIRFRTWSPAAYTGVLCAVLIHCTILFTPLGGWLIGTTPQLHHLAYATVFALIVFIAVSEITKAHSRRTVRQKEEKIT